MKIQGSGGGELLRRMQQAHEQASVSGPAAADASAARFDPQAGDVSGADRIEAPDAAEPPLHTKIKDVARRALDGEFQSEGDVRGAVVEEIVDEKFGGRVSRSGQREMTGVVRDALVDDPEFGRQIDDMLVMAARELAVES